MAVNLRTHGIYLCSSLFHCKKKTTMCHRRLELRSPSMISRRCSTIEPMALYDNDSSAVCISVHRYFVALQQKIKTKNKTCATRDSNSDLFQLILLRKRSTIEPMALCDNVCSSIFNTRHGCKMRGKKNT